MMNKYGPFKTALQKFKNTQQVDLDVFSIGDIVSDVVFHR